MGVLAFQSPAGHLLSRDLADLPLGHPSEGKELRRDHTADDFQVTGGLACPAYCGGRRSPHLLAGSMVDKARIVQLRSAALPGAP